MPELRLPLGPACCVLIMSAAAVEPAQGQWEVDLHVGSAVHEGIEPAASTHSANLVLRRRGDEWLYLNGGMPMDSRSGYWAGGGIGGERSRGSAVRVGLYGQLHGFGYWGFEETPGGSVVLAEAGPLIRAPAGPTTLFATLSVTRYASAADAVTLNRTLGSALAKATVRIGSELLASPVLRYVREGDRGFPFMGAEASWSEGSVGAWAHYGRWAAEEIEVPEWSLGVSFAPAGRARLEASVRQDTNEPVYWTDPRRAWSLGVSYELGGRAGMPAVPLLPEVRGGQVILRLPLSAVAGTPTVAGDFTGWESVPMTRAPEGWVVALPIPPGVYRYAFRSESGEWFLPEGVSHRVDDGFGGENAVLVVP
jgi:hypothetical protein